MGIRNGKAKTLKILIIGFLSAALTCSSSYATDIYNGTLVDAHSQKGTLISAEEVSEHINKSDVDLTLLSFRGGHKKLNKNFLAIDKLTQNKVRYLLPTKLSARVRGAPMPKVISLLNRFKKGALKNDISYVGFGELLVQHTAHDNKHLKWDGVNYSLNDAGILQVINFIISDNKPVILHVELNDYEKDSKKKV